MTAEGDQMIAQHDSAPPPPRKISVFGRQFTMPQSRWLRIVIGVVLIIFGCLGFLPILGFWMVPLGLLVLSYEFASVRRLRRRSVVWWERRRRRRQT
ncbi:PGPGW domain-containing protein [Mesorhizobium sp. Root554]|uniref:PGPGW domain-containing protein n=2 Tax=Mesorhizobium TaxID=68287 RepID=UPI001FCD61F0|nr:PGPGW domain-containing protein [Mesorhizobium sp. Root554]